MSVSAVLAASRRWPRQSAADPRTAPVYFLLLLGIGLVGAALVFGRFSWSASPVDTLGPKLVLFVAIACGLRHFAFTAPAAALEATALMIAISLIGPLCAVVVATTARPLADEALLAADAQLFFGFDRRHFAAAMASWPTAMTVMAWCYNSMLVQPFALVLFLATQDGQRHLWHLLTSWIIALACSILIFMILPAYGTPPYVLNFETVMDGARDGSLTTLGGHTLTGIITFPSFHAAGAVMLAWGWWKIDRLKIAGLVLNAAMMLSALVGGGHYLIDLVAGTAVAAGALVAGKALQERIGRRPQELT